MAGWGAQLSDSDDAEPADDLPQPQSHREAGEDAVRAYLRRVGSIPRLTPVEEVFYARQYQQARDAAQQLLCAAPTLLLSVLSELAGGADRNRLAHLVDANAYEDPAEMVRQVHAVLASAQSIERLMRGIRRPTTARARSASRSCAPRSIACCCGCRCATASTRSASAD